MSDKETAPWMKEAAESIALAALRYRTFQMPTHIAEIIASHCPVAVECRAPAPRCIENWCVLPVGHSGDHSNVNVAGPFARQQSIAEQQKSLDLRQAELRGLSAVIEGKLSEMDVASPSNTGWKARNFELLLMLAKML